MARRVLVNELERRLVDFVVNGSTASQKLGKVVQDAPVELGMALIGQDPSRLVQPLVLTHVGRPDREPAPGQRPRRDNLIAVEELVPHGLTLEEGELGHELWREIDIVDTILPAIVGSDHFYSVIAEKDAGE